MVLITPEYIFLVSYYVLKLILSTYFLKCDNDKTNKNVDHEERNDNDIDHIKQEHMRTGIWYLWTFPL